MSKLDIPVFKYLAQDMCGDIYTYADKPVKVYARWNSVGHLLYVTEGRSNPNWDDTLIDLEKGDYEFEDGILRRIEK